MMSEHATLSDKQARALIEPFRVEHGSDFRFDRVSTSEPGRTRIDKAQAKAWLEQGVSRLASRQPLLYADARWSLLIVFQAMDAGGKDGTIKHVLSGVNPQGVTTVSFKPPGPEELGHDFLWRVHRALPARGMIGVFNRSHYEEVVVTRVHPELLARQRLPKGFTEQPEFWAERIADINAFEAYLTRQGTKILKIFLHISPEEQRKRLLARLDDPEKMWKFDAGDLRERKHWGDYMQAYQEAIAGTSTPHSPWYVVPADQKGFARLVVISAMNAMLDDLDLRPAEITPEVRAQIDEARRELG